MSGEGEGAVAVVDVERCIGCGICLGSCAFDAIAGFEDGTLETLEVAGPTVLVCARQARLGDVPGGANPIEVRCTGMLNPRAISSLVERGASSVQVIGCPPGDCPYGTGNLLTSERLLGSRRPLLPRRWQGSVRQDWVSPTDLAEAFDRPGGHPVADVDSAPAGWKVLVPAILVVAASVVAIRFATDAPFRPGTSDAIVRVVVDHVAGQRLEGQTTPTSGPAVLELAVGGEIVVTHDFGAADHLLDVVDVELTPGTAALTVSLVEGSGVTTLFDGSATLEAGRRLVLEARDAPPDPGVALGRELFEGGGLGANLGCGICHSREPGRVLVGPSLAGIADVAGGRIPGMTAAEYLRRSIVDPDAYVVEGSRPGQMPSVYGDRLTDDEIEALVIYLLSLTEEAAP